MARAAKKSDTPELVTRLYTDKLAESGLTVAEAERLGLSLVRTREAAADAPNGGLIVATEWSIRIPYFDKNGAAVMDGPESAERPYYRLRRIGPLVGFHASTDPRKYQNERGTLPHAYFPQGLLKRPWAEVLADVSMPLFIVEGEFKAACMCLHGFACIGLGGVDSFGSAANGIPLLEELGANHIRWAGRSVYVIYDSDVARNPNIRRARRTIAARLNDDEIRAHVYLVDLPPPADPKTSKLGVDDFIVAHGVDALQARIEAAKLAPPRVPILLGAETEDEVDLAISGLPVADNLYQRHGRLVQITYQLRQPDQGETIKRPAGSPRILTVQRARLQGLLSVVTSCFRHNGEGERKPEAPPDRLADGVLQRGEWPGVPVLTSVIEAPTLLPDGSVLTMPGYDVASGLFYSPSGLGDVLLPDNPTRMDARRAAEALLDVVCDVDFATEVDRAAWLAAALTPFCRHALGAHARVPIFVTNGNAPGIGKTLTAATLIGILYRGRAMSTMEAPDSDAEMAKRLTTFALAGDPLICIDNVSGTFGWPSLDKVITSGEHSGRILGRNDADARVDVPMGATFYATGNNVAFVGDVVRRVLEIRLETTDEHPEMRQGFKHKDLEAHVIAHRTELVTAALTILRAYCAAGQPPQQLTGWGSFEKWSALVRGAIVWAGLPDPGSNRVSFAEQADKRHDVLAQVIAGLEVLAEHDMAAAVRLTKVSGRAVRPELAAGIAAKDLRPRAEQAGSKAAGRDSLSAEQKAAVEGLRAALDALGGEGPRFNTQRLGEALASLLRRPVGGKCLDRVRDQHAKVWLYRVIETPKRAARKVR